MKQDDNEIINQIKEDVANCYNSSSTWRSNQSIWHKLRMRIKKTKTFPFPGCSNIRMPTLETKIRKTKAALYRTIFGIRPLVQVVPNPSGNWETARKIEKFLDHMLVDVMKIKKQAVIAIDQALEKGFFLLKPYWNLNVQTRTYELDLSDLSETEVQGLQNPMTPPDAIIKALNEKVQADMDPYVAEFNTKALMSAYNDYLKGKKKFKITVKDVITNNPAIALCEPERVYTPVTAGIDPQDSDWIVHEFFVSVDQLKINAKEKGWDIENFDDFLNANEKKEESIDVLKDQREGIDRFSETNLVKIWEYYGYYDLKGNGTKENAVITIAPEFGKIFRKIGNPFYSGKKPFVKVYFDLTDDRWFSHRGLPELLEDIVKEIDVQHMQKIDSQTLRNVPMFLYRAGAINPKTVQFNFGSGIPVNGLEELDNVIKPFSTTNTNAEYSYEREQQILESKIEELTGQVDYTLQSMINKREPRTLGEVNMQRSDAQTVFSLDLDVVRNSFSELFTWVWDLWCQYGPEEYEFSYFGENGYETIKMGKEEVQNKYTITIKGTDENTNPKIKMQKAQQIIMAITNPTLIQSGVIGPQNIMNGLRRFFQTLDIENYEEFLNEQLPDPKSKVGKNMLPSFEDLTDAEQAQILAKTGIKPDLKGRALRQQHNLVNDFLDRQSE